MASPLEQLEGEEIRTLSGPAVPWMFLDEGIDEWLEASAELAAKLCGWYGEGDRRGCMVRLGDGQVDPEDEDWAPVTQAVPSIEDDQPEIIVGPDRKPQDLLKEIVDEARREEIEREARRYSAAAEIGKFRWNIATQVHRLEDGNSRLNWETHPFLPAIYQDDSMDGILMGSAQFGKTEWMICDIAASAAYGLKVLVVISKHEKRDKFAAGRLDPCFKQVKFYKRMIDMAAEKGRKVDSVRFKHFGDGSINLIGAMSEKDFTSYAADKCDVDEHQECDQDNLSKLDHRMSGSPFRFMWRIGHPDVEGSEENGNLDWLYQNSDQRIWKVPCATCGERQELEWEQHVVHVVRNKQGGIMGIQPRDQEWQRGGRLDLRAVCTFCHRPMNRLSRKGEWEIRQPQFVRHGWSLSNLYNSNKRMGELFENFTAAQYKPGLMKEFVNKQLGKVYNLSGARITDAALQQCSTGEYSGIAPYRFVPATWRDWKTISDGQEAYL